MMSYIASIAPAIALVLIFAVAYYFAGSDEEYHSKWKKYRDRYYGDIPDDDDEDCK